MFSKDLVNNKVNGLSYYLYHDFQTSDLEDFVETIENLIQAECKLDTYGWTAGVLLSKTNGENVFVVQGRFKDGEINKFIICFDRLPDDLPEEILKYYNSLLSEDWDVEEPDFSNWISSLGIDNFYTFPSVDMYSGTPIINKPNIVN